WRHRHPHVARRRASLAAPTPAARPWAAPAVWERPEPALPPVSESPREEAVPGPRVLGVPRAPTVERAHPHSVGVCSGNREASGREILARSSSSGHGGILSVSLP